VIAAGWGTLDFGGRPSEVLKHVFLNVVSSNSCTATQMCTLTPGRDTCQNDSGGPLFFVDSNGLIYNVGVISEGIACDSGFPGINTRITEYLTWIEQNTPNTIYCVR
jgi:trypsin